MKILRYQRLKSEKGIDFSRVHLGRLMKAGKFPKSIKIGDNTIGWIEAEVDAWLKARVAQREAA